MYNVVPVYLCMCTCIGAKKLDYWPSRLKQDTRLLLPITLPDDDYFQNFCVS